MGTLFDAKTNESNRYSHYLKHISTDLITFINGDWQGSLKSEIRTNCIDKFNVDRYLVTGTSMLCFVTDTFPRTLSFSLIGGFLSPEVLELYYRSENNYLFGKQRLTINQKERWLKGEFNSVYGADHKTVSGEIFLRKIGTH